jgi:MFS family permease
VRSQAIAGLLAQISQGAMSVGLILLVHAQTGSLALAGAVVGAVWIAAGLSRPVQGRLIDRRGPGAVMAACGVVHAAALAVIVGLSALHAPGSLLVLFGALTGLALPPVSAAMRVAWADVAEADERAAAYSLVYLVQEVAILTGPLLLAALVATISVSVALLVVAAVTVAGALGFASWAPLAGARLPGLRRRDQAVLRIRAMQVLLAVAVLLGAMIGGIQVGAPTFATARGAPAAAGLLIASLSVGGIIGAAIYGSRRWRAATSTRLLLLLAWMTAALVFTIGADRFVVLAVFLIVAGVAFNPALSTLSLLVDQHVPAGSAGESFGWLSTGIAAGTGAGSALAAALAQHQHHSRPAFILAAVAGAAATAVALAGRRQLAQAA